METNPAPITGEPPAADPAPKPGKKTRRHWSAEEKALIAKEAEGDDPAIVARRYNINPNTLGDCRKRYAATLAAPESPPLAPAPKIEAIAVPPQSIEMQFCGAIFRIPAEAIGAVMAALSQIDGG
jgi:transposase-like protein